MVSQKLIAAAMAAVVVLGSVAQAQDMNICNIRCVGEEVYNVFCGGAICVSGAQDDIQFAGLCSDSCSDAIVGEPLFNCLSSSLPDRSEEDIKDIQLNWLEEINSVCGEEEIVAPAPGPAFEDEDFDLDEFR